MHEVVMFKQPGSPYSTPLFPKATAKTQTVYSVLANSGPSTVMLCVVASNVDDHPGFVAGKYTMPYSSRAYPPKLGSVHDTFRELHPGAPVDVTLGAVTRPYGVDATTLLEGP